MGIFFCTSQKKNKKTQTHSHCTSICPVCLDPLTLNLNYSSSNFFEINILFSHARRLIWNGLTSIRKKASFSSKGWSVKALFKRIYVSVSSTHTSNCTRRLSGLWHKLEYEYKHILLSGVFVLQNKNGTTLTTQALILQQEPYVPFFSL